MSFSDDLYRPAAIQAIRKYSCGGVPMLERATKRRRLNSSNSSTSRSIDGDSGYNSDDERLSQASPTVSDHHKVPEVEPERAGDPKRRRINSEPIQSTRAPTELFQRYLSRCAHFDRRRYEKRSSNQPTDGSSVEANARNADLDIISAQHQIALARQRLHSYSCSTPTTRRDSTDLGRTAGPKAAKSSTMSSRVFDGCFITESERILLEELTVTSQQKMPQTQVEPPLELTPDEKKEVEQEVQYAGLAMPADFGDDDLDYEPGTYHNEGVDSDFESFFKLDEASTPSEDAPSP